MSIFFTLKNINDKIRNFDLNFQKQVKHTRLRQPGKKCSSECMLWRPSGLMDKASASGAGDCGFKSHLGRSILKCPWSSENRYWTLRPHKSKHAISSKWITFRKAKALNDILHHSRQRKILICSLTLFVKGAYFLKYETDEGFTNGRGRNFSNFAMRVKVVCHPERKAPLTPSQSLWQTLRVWSPGRKLTDLKMFDIWMVRQSLMP